MELELEAPPNLAKILSNLDYFRHVLRAKGRQVKRPTTIQVIALLFLIVKLRIFKRINALLVERALPEGLVPLIYSLAPSSLLKLILCL